MKKILEKYFKTHPLEILDGGIPAATTVYGNKTYSAVTFNYIYQYVLKKKFSIKDLPKILIELYNENKIKIGPCSHIQNLVFFVKCDYTTWWKIFAINDNLILADHNIYSNKMRETIEFFNKCINDEKPNTNKSS